MLEDLRSRVVIDIFVLQGDLPPPAADRPSLVKEMAVSSALIQCPTIAGPYASSSSRLLFERMRQAISSFYLYTLGTGSSSFHVLRHA